MGGDCWSCVAESGVGLLSKDVKVVNAVFEKNKILRIVLLVEAEILVLMGLRMWGVVIVRLLSCAQERRHDRNKMKKQEKSDDKTCCEGDSGEE